MFYTTNKDYYVFDTTCIPYMLRSPILSWASWIPSKLRDCVFVWGFLAPHPPKLCKRCLEIFSSICIENNMMLFITCERWYCLTAIPLLLICLTPIPNNWQTDFSNTLVRSIDTLVHVISRYTCIEPLSPSWHLESPFWEVLFGSLSTELQEQTTVINKGYCHWVYW